MQHIKQLLGGRIHLSIIPKVKAFVEDNVCEIYFTYEQCRDLSVLLQDDFPYEWADGANGILLFRM